MVDKKSSKGVISSERQEIMGASQGFMTNKDNQFYARTQSTPLEQGKPQKKALVAPSKATLFVPKGNLGELTNDFLGTEKGQQTQTQTQTKPEQVPLKTGHADNLQAVNNPSATSETTSQTGTSDSTTAPPTEKVKKPLRLKTTSQQWNPGATSGDILKEKEKEKEAEHEKEKEKEKEPGEWGKKIPKAPIEEKVKSPAKQKQSEAQTKAKNAVEKSEIKVEPTVEPEIVEDKRKKIDILEETKKTAKTIPEEDEHEASPKNENNKPAPSEQTFSKPAQKEIKIEIVLYSRGQMEEALRKFAELHQDQPLPEALEKIKNRDIIAEQADSRGKDRKGTVGPKANKEGGGMERGSLVKSGSKAADQLKSQGSGIIRQAMTEDEIKKKKELEQNVNVWMKNIKTEDPEKIAEKKIKMNLNIITPDNFEVIKEEIHKLAAEKIEFTERVGDLIIENAWTQKHYANTYAKLCDYLGKSEKLFFKEESKKGKKNDFKLHIMKKIQTVFEDESKIQLSQTKKPEDMSKEERVEYYAKKKQKIIGNVCFIGELFLEKFIVLGIVRIITNSLLMKFLDEYNTYQKAEEKPTNKSFEDTLEGLIKFYELIGKIVEEKEASKVPDKQKSANMVQNFERVLTLAHAMIPTDEELPRIGNDDISLDDLFKILDIINNKGSLSNRISALIKNLSFRKDNKWQAPLYKNQGPKKIAEIYNEYEKEQEDIERRANEYYQEEISSRSYRKGGKQDRDRDRERDSYFQVYEAKPKQASTEESKLDLADVKVDESQTFKPQRGKQATQDKQDKGKKMLISHEELEKEMKDTYELLSEDTFENKQEEILECLKKIAEKVPSRDLIQAFLKTFYDGRLSEVNKRHPIANLMLEHKLITQEEFMKSLGIALSRMTEIACDYPSCDTTFAILILDFIRKYPGEFKFANIKIPEEFLEGEDAEMYLEFYQSLYHQFISKLNSEFSDVKGSLSEEDLSNFATKIKAV